MEWTKETKSLLLRIIGVILVIYVAYELHLVFFKPWSGERYASLLLQKGMFFAAYIAILCGIFFFVIKEDLGYYMIGVTGAYFACSCGYSIWVLLRCLYENSQPIEKLLCIVYIGVCAFFLVVTIFFLRDFVIEAWDGLRKLRERKARKAC